MEFPGKKLADEIEYASGHNTYSEEDIVRATACGNTELDSEKRIVAVKPYYNAPKKLYVGQELYGRINESSETSATMTITADNSTQKFDASNDFAMLKIEGVKSGGVFIRSMKDVLRAGDIVKVEIFSTRRGGIDVSMKRPDLGVIKAFCCNCRGVLKLTKDNKLFCGKCNSYESRKIGSPYLEVME